MLTWIFDLDNTLHDASPHIFPHINRSMTAYMREHLVLGEDEASALRTHYWKVYGATLLGLMRHHGTDPRHFLRETHQFPALDRMVVSDRAVLASLKRLRGRKLLFTNAPFQYASAVLDILRIADRFDAVYAVEHVRFQPKPLLAGFRRLLRVERLQPAGTVMVDDTLSNLRAARRLGMRTVWVSRAPRAPSYVDLRVASVRELPRLADDLARRGSRDHPC